MTRRSPRRWPLGLLAKAKRQKTHRLRVENLEDRTVPATIQWALPVNGDFNDGTKWTGGIAPGATDDAVINFDNVTVTSPVNTTVNSLVTIGDLSVTAGTFTVSNGGSFNNDIVVAAGATFDLAGGSLGWTAGLISGAGTFEVSSGASLALSGPIAKVMNTATLDNLGTINFGGDGPLQLNSDAHLNNSGSFHFLSDADVTYAFGTVPIFTNTGLVTKTGGTGLESDIQPFFNNEGGTITVNDGRLSLDGGTSTGGVYNVTNPSAILDLTGGDTQNYTGVYTGSGPGTVLLDSGAINVTLTDATFNFPAGLFEWTGGTLTGLVGSTLTNAGEVTMTGTGSKDLYNVVFNNSGTVNVADTGDWRAVATNITNSGTIDFKGNAGLTWTFGGQPSLTNTGTVKKTAGIVISTLSVPMNNTAAGTVSSESGTLAITRDGASNGTFTATAGNVVDFTGGYTFNTGTSGTGAGQIRFSGSTLTVAGAVTIENFAWTTGTITGAGGLTVTYSLDLSGSGPKDLRAATLTNEGTATLDGIGNLRLYDGATFQNNGSFTFESDSWVQWSFGAGGNAFNNTGTVTKTSSTITGTSGFDNLDFNNTGTVNVASGILFIDKGTESGDFVVAPAATLWFAQNTIDLSSGTSFSGSGKVLISAGTVNFNSDVNIANLALSGGALGGAGVVTVGTQFAWTGGTIVGETVIAPGAIMAIGGGAPKDIAGGILTNNGTATFAGTGAIRMLDAATIQNNGSFTLLNDSGIGYFFGSPGNVFHNAGTVTKTSSTSTGSSRLQGITFNNTGSVNVSSGELWIESGTHTGNFNVADDATLLFLLGTSTLNAGASFSGEGVVAVAAAGGGTLLVNSPVSIDNLAMGSGRITGPSILTVSDEFDWTGGVIGTPGVPFTLTVAPGATLDISGVSGKSLDTGTIRNEGTMVFGGTGNIGFGNAATLRNLGTIDIQTDADFVDGGFGAGGNRIVNTGTLNTTAGVGTTSIIFNVNLDNTGTLEIASGAIFINSSVVQLSGGTLTAGIWKVGQGSTLVFPSNVTTNNANVTMEGSGATFAQMNPLTTNNGTFRVAGGLDFATTGALTNNGTVVVGPESTLTVNGAYTQNGTGKFISEIADQPASGDFGVLAVTGAATLNGTVQVDLVNGFGPSEGGNFEIMTFASQSGNFTFVSPKAPKQGDLFVPVVNPTNLTAFSALSASDLAVTDVFVPAAAVPGQTVQIGYVVKNLSTTATVITDWVDSVYLSKDGTLDASDILVQRVAHSGTLNPGATYNGQTDIALPGLNPGDYRVIVVADSRMFVPDTNRPNNTVTAPATLAVSVPALTIGQTTSGTIANGQDVYYRVDLPAGKTFKIGASFQVASELEMYVGYKYVPSRTTFDQSTFPVGQTTGAIVLPGTQAGPFYILLHGREGATGGKNFDLLVEQLTFSITSLENAKGSNLGSTTVTINGAGFTPTTTARLQGGVVDLAATQVYFVDSTKLYATFNLNGVPADQYDVKVLNGAVPTSLADAFTVTTGAAGRLVLNLSLPAISRALARTTATINYENAGETDIPAPLLFLTSDTGDLRLPEQADYVGKSLAFMGINPVGPAGILPAGFKGKLTVEVFNTSNRNSQGVTYNLKSVADPATPIDWASLKAGMRPADIPADAWDVVFANFVARVGPNLMTYQQRLADDATYLSQIGAATRDPTRLLQFELNQANAALTGSALATAVDAAVPAPGVGLAFTRAYNATVAGRYNLGRLGRGWTDNWDITAATDPRGNVTLSYGGVARLFARNPDGTYAATPGDRGTLLSTAGAYRVTEVDGRVTAFRPDGKLDFVRDSNGNQVTAAYDGQNRLATLTHTSGASLALAYDANGRINTVTDSAGRVSIYTYDPGTGEELTGYTDVTGSVGYSYAAGQGAAREYALTRITREDGSQTNFAYDAQGRLQTRALTAGAEALTYSYGAAGGYTVTDAAGGSATLDIDDRSLVRRTTDPLGNVTRADYDAASRPTRQSQADGTTNSFAYDAAGNLATVTDPLGRTTAFTYDAANQLTGYSDAAANTTAFQYDARRNVTRVTYADGSFESFAYDARGNVTARMNARGQTLQYTYNAAGQVTNKTFADTSSADYGYDARGRMVTTVDASGSYALTYNGLDQLTRLATPGGQALDFTYDAVGRRATMTDQTGFEVRYQYDAVGRLDALKDGSNNVLAAYTYDQAGRVSREDKGNGTFTTYGYDLASNVLSLVNRADAGTVNSSFAYAYDPLNRVASMTTGGVTTDYGYFADGVLASVTLPGRSLLYTYDAAGNRKTTSDNGVVTAFTANNRNEITAAGADTFGYDADGNRTTQTVGGVTTTFTFRQDNRLTGLATPAAGIADTFAYDPFGQRSSATRNGTTTNYLVDPAGLGSVVSEYDGTGALIAHYTQGRGMVSRVDAGGAAAYYDFDRLGNTAGLTDDTRVVVNSYSYLPFGETTMVSAAVANPYTFVGRFGVSADAGGLFNMRAREYDPRTGQFLSDDPLGLVASDPNVRRYVGNNPVSFIDPAGLTPWDSNWPFGPPPGAQPPNFPPPESPQGGEFDPDERLNDLYDEYVAREAAAEKRLNDLYDEYVAREAAADKRLNDLYDDYTKRQPGGPGSSPNGPATSFPPGSFTPGTTGPSGRSPTGGGEDPNDLTGPAGFGPQGFIPGGVTLPYTIRFENLAAATLPAQVVTVTQTLDADLDLDTFELTGFGFGPYRVDVPAGRDNYTARVDARATTNLLVDVAARLDRTTRVFSITYTSIDPLTLDFTSDTLGGFLPPNNAANDGRGFVSYTIRPKTGLPTGTPIDGNPARIVFDTNDPIDTNPTLNTIDVGIPNATVTELPEISTTLTFPVSWSGTDDLGGSGVGKYDVYVSDNNGPWTLWQSQTSATTADYTGLEYRTYRFYAVGTDNAGNQESSLAAPEATIIATAGAYAKADVYGADAGKTLTISPKKGLLANDPKLAGRTYTVQVVTQPSKGTLTMRLNGGFTYVPAPTFTGLDAVDTFTYQTLDSNSQLSNLATVTLATQLVNFKTVRSTAPESKATLTIFVELRKLTTDVTTVNYTLNGITATAGADFNATGGTVTFQPGVRKQTIIVPIVNDTTDENNETFRMTLSNPTLATLGQKPSTVVTIKDNDAPPKVGFSVVSSSFSEAAGTVTVAVGLSALSEKSVSVQFALKPGGTATSGTDYTFTPGTLTFAPGETLKFITLSLANDVADESDETILFKLLKPKNAKMGASSHTLTLADNDP